MNFFIDLIYEYGLLAMFFIILIEYACFPISSEIVLPFSGAFASVQHIDFLVILPVSVLAGLLGTSICYTIGFIGGGPIIDTLKRKFPKTKKGIDSSFDKFNKYGCYAVCIGRVIPLCRTYIAFAAGVAKQNILLFLGSSFIGITIWNTLLIGLGYVFHENWNIVSTYYDQYKTIVIPIICIVIIGIVIKVKFFKKGTN